jgi:hypothetical protein
MDRFTSPSVLPPPHVTVASSSSATHFRLYVTVQSTRYGAFPMDCALQKKDTFAMLDTLKSPLAPNMPLASVGNANATKVISETDSEGAT